MAPIGPKSKTKSILRRVGIGVLVALILALAGTAAFWHKKAGDYRSKLASAAVEKLKMEDEKEGFRLKALNLEELAKENASGKLVKPGQVIQKSGFYLTKIEFADYTQCKKYRKTVGEVLLENEKAKLIAIDNRDLALKGKRVWRTVGLVAAGVTVGMLVNGSLRK